MRVDFRGPRPFQHHLSVAVFFATVVPALFLPRNVGGQELTPESPPTTSVPGEETDQPAVESGDNNQSSASTQEIVGESPLAADAAETPTLVLLVNRGDEEMRMPCSLRFEVCSAISP